MPAVLFRLLESPAWTRLVEFVTLEHIPDVILHIITCRVLIEKDLFTLTIYAVWNSIPLNYIVDCLQVNPFMNIGKEIRMYDIAEYIDLRFAYSPHWFTYDISKGGVYYLSGQKKRSSGQFDFNCDLDLMYEFNYNYLE